MMMTIIIIIMIIIIIIIFNIYMVQINIQGPVVRTPVSTNPGLNFNPGFFFFLSKALFRIIFYIIFSVSIHQIVGKEN